MKRALPIVVIVVALAAVIAWVALRSTPAAGPTGPASVIKPTLKVVNETGAAVTTGTLVVPAGAPFDLRLTIESNAYVYLFDDSQGQVSVVWKHAEATPWEKGEYSADAPAFEGLGEHHVVLVASPTAATTVDTWKSVSPEALATLCPQCERATYGFYVSAAVDGGAAP